MQEIQRGQLRLVHSDVLDLPSKQLLQAAHDCEDLSEVRHLNEVSLEVLEHIDPAHLATFCIPVFLKLRTLKGP